MRRRTHKAGFLSWEQQMVDLLVMDVMPSGWDIISREERKEKKEGKGENHATEMGRATFEWRLMMAKFIGMYG